MILAIDAGNTHIVLGMIENGEIRHIARIHTEARETGTEYALKLRQIIDFHGVDPTAFEGAIIGSVVPPVTEALRFAAERVTGCRPMVVGPGVKTGMNIRIDDPTTVAADLIVGAVAANTHYGAPCIVIDMGTATTMIVVDRDGCFRGGAIAPGVKLGYRALSAETSLLPEIAIQAPKKAVSANTIDAMRAGAVYGSAAYIDGMVERMESELGYPCTVVATGSIARHIVPFCRRKDIVVDGELLLKGLWAIYKKNK